MNINLLQEILKLDLTTFRYKEQKASWQIVNGDYSSLAWIIKMGRNSGIKWQL